MRTRECIILALWLLTALSAWAADDAAEFPEGLGLDVPPVKIGTAAPLAPAPIEHLRWSGTPIPLALPVGQDRVVRFPADVRVGPPGKLLEVLQTTAADGAVYFRALAPFEPTLVRYPLQVVLMDVDPEHNPWGLALDGYGSDEPMQLTEDEAKQAFALGDQPRPP